MTPSTKALRAVVLPAPNLFVSKTRLHSGSASPQMLERESSREKNLEKAAKDARGRARRAAAAAAEEGAAKSDAAATAEAKALADAEAEFYALSGIKPMPIDAVGTTPVAPPTVAALAEEAGGAAAAPPQLAGTPQAVEAAEQPPAVI